MPNIIYSGGGVNIMTLPDQITNLACVGGTDGTAGTIDVSFTEVPNTSWSLLQNYLLVYKAGSIPQTPFDGTRIVLPKGTAGAQKTYQITGLTFDQLYGVRIYPVSTKYQHQTAEEGATATATPKSFATYGIHIDTQNSNPYTAVTYTDDAVGMLPCSVSGLTFQYSDLVYDVLLRFELYPCVVKNGLESYRLNPSNLAQKIDGTPSDITSGMDGDAFLHHKECWLWFGDTGDRKISDVAQEGWMRVPEGYYPLFKGYSSGGKMRSLANKTFTVNLTTTADRAAATANGTGYQKLTFLQRMLYETLAYIMFKSIAPFSGGSATLTGEFLNRGMCWVSSPYVVFLWSEVCCDAKHCMCDGVVSSGSNYLYVKLSSPYSNSTSGYTNTDILIPNDYGGVNRYITVMKGSNTLGILPYTRSGSSSTFYTGECDVDPGGQALVGGYSKLSGLNIWDLSSSGRPDSYSAICFSPEN